MPLNAFASCAPYEGVRVDIHRRLGQFSPEYVRLNPGMTVPTLELETRVLADSRDILLYAFDMEDSLDSDTEPWLARHYSFPIDELTFALSPCPKPHRALDRAEATAKAGSVVRSVG
jgi:hypothetical protein